MPWPTTTSHTSSCVYELCERDGHAVCHAFADYYERLCKAAQRAVDDHSLENMAALREVLSEEKGIQYD